MTNPENQDNKTDNKTDKEQDKEPDNESNKEMNKEPINEPDNSQKLEQIIEQEFINTLENKPSFIDELYDFCIELSYMIYNDFRNSFKFIRENKNYIGIAVVLGILLQFTNLTNLGTSFEKYCNKKFNGEDNGQIGGGVQAPEKSPEEIAERKRQKKKASKAYHQHVQAARQDDKESKANEKRISFFEGLKNKFSVKLSDSTIFGRFDLIMDSVKNIFYIITIILTIAGIISIPVLIFLVITYMVFKVMVSKFVIL
jgi:hypothetical protein